MPIRYAGRMEREADPPEREPAADDAPRELHVTIKGTAPEAWSIGVELATAAVTACALLLAAGLLDGAATGRAAPVFWAVGALAHLAVVRPIGHAVRRLRADDARLRAALGCPFCKDALPAEAAVACQRPGCGACYHLECWSECRQSYGGCAIFGCGSREGREVGSFALTRRIVWQVIATALFPPRLARRAVAYRVKLAQDAPQGVVGTPLGHGLWAFVALALAVGSVAGIFVAGELGRRRVIADAWVAVAMGLAFVVLPIAAVRGPLALLAAVLELFSDELAVLQRADEGTFLARAASAGKKVDDQGGEVDEPHPWRARES